MRLGIEAERFANPRKTDKNIAAGGKCCRQFIIQERDDLLVNGPFFGNGESGVTIGGALFFVLLLIGHIRSILPLVVP